MSPTTDTARVAGRRTLRFERLADIGADVDRLASANALTALGNWSPGQVFEHLALTMRYSLDGPPKSLPAPLRFVLRTLVLRRLMNSPMKPGFKLPKAMSALLPPPVSTEAGLANLRKQLTRLQQTAERAPHAAFGSLNCEQWDKVHCRHCELHLSFLLPQD